MAGLLPFCECKVRHYFWIVQIFGKNFYKKIFFLACGVESAGPNRRLGVGAVGAFLGGALPFEGVKNGVKLRGGEKNWQNLWIIENFGVTLHRKTEGRLAQLVQSVCLTSRGSGVRIPQRPLNYLNGFAPNLARGRLAQLVQSICLTSRGSGVRIPQRPHKIFPFIGALSSAGSERLPYKQRVGGSNPSAPTTTRPSLRRFGLFFVPGEGSGRVRFAGVGERPYLCR